MYVNCKGYFIKVLSPLHAGTGRGYKGISLAIQREIASSLPKIEATVIKGAFREKSELDKDEIYGKSDKRSTISFNDAKLLFFSFRITGGLFCLGTCPYILKRYFEDELYKLCFREDDKFKRRIKLVEEVIDALDSLDLSLGKYLSLLDDNSEIKRIEEYDFKAGSLKRLEKRLVEKLDEYFKGYKEIVDIEKIVVLSNRDFKELVDLSTEKIYRIKIDDKKMTTEDGSLFSQEFLPEESILYGVIFEKANQSNKEIMKEFFNKLERSCFIGSGRAIGKGKIKIIGDKYDK
ncbi:type III-B CRISPR module RAMP protein Cmr4 [Halonatronum saccharophilum]|uniref:type III-B CRISPR module RAMP protein Cmr4 n=1 Tax=Halonatronum saccharophilum TaxID=150060 RepID=UPI000481F8F5|nr:type III-B CRISPR module RAMP protein Cmr4 [Halonatronum saccharophilum]